MPLQRLESGALVQHAAWIALHLAGYDNRARVLEQGRRYAPGASMLRNRRARH